ncbi:hypothetical protein EYF80_052106 [Liparis tanakae]|uniref:Uncharacterized protein n=1 Tax=Liparis tanakae TaxID=230148 RepID=A0A4Z2F917_9TELE|nr:hypothetical protein EYF80_052106 [Liparis tanakae]
MVTSVCLESPACGLQFTPALECTRPSLSPPPPVLLHPSIAPLNEHVKAERLKKCEMGSGAAAPLPFSPQLVHCLPSSSPPRCFALLLLSSVLRGAPRAPEVDTSKRRPTARTTRGY